MTKWVVREGKVKKEGRYYNGSVRTATASLIQIHIKWAYSNKNCKVTGDYTAAKRVAAMVQGRVVRLRTREEDIKIAKAAALHKLANDMLTQAKTEAVQGDRVVLRLWADAIRKRALAYWTKKRKGR